MKLPKEKVGLFLLIAVCALVFSSPGAGTRKKEDTGKTSFQKKTGDVDLEVDILPEGDDKEVVLSQGQAFLVRIRDPKNLVQKAHASWEGQTIPCLPHHQHMGRLHGLGGIDRRQKPGTYKLSIRLITRGGEVEKLEKNFRVKKTRFTSGRLTVASDKVDLSKTAVNRIREERKAFKNAWDSSSYIRFWNGPFILPVKGRITSPFGERRVYNNGKLKNVHRGTDLSASVGDPIKATAASKVVLSGFCYLEGGLVIMDHGGGLFTLYCHLSEIKVKQGDTVDKGHVIGIAGSTGRVTGPHLHWGCGVQGVRVDPMSLLNLNKWLKDN